MRHLVLLVFCITLAMVFGSPLIEKLRQKRGVYGEVIASCDDCPKVCHKAIGGNVTSCTPSTQFPEKVDCFCESRETCRETSKGIKICTG